MKLRALRLHNVRRFAARGVALEGIGDGVNVLCAANEYGKSTCFDALHALFFQAHTGTPGAVQALRPYSGGSPLVEADIATGDGLFRLAKQFYAGKRATVTDLGSGRLVAQADEAEAFIAGLVRGGTAGPAGLLWVRQGITGIERRVKSDEEGEKRARENVLSSVRGEVEALTGGRRMQEVAALCADDLSRYVTATGRPKAGGPYAQALEARDRLAGGEQRLATEVQALRAALDRRRAARARLAEIESAEQDGARRGALAQAEADWAEAKARGEALKTALAEATLAQGQRDMALAARDSHRRDQARLRELGGLHAAALQRRDEASRLQQAAIAAGANAARAIDDAERDEREARDLLARLDRALRAREAAERLAGLRETMEKAEAARAEVERIEAALSTLAISQQDIQRLEACETELAGLRAVAAAKRPSLRMDYDSGAADRLSLDGTVLADGQERPLSATALLAIPGLGRLTVMLPREAAETDGIATTEAKRRALLDRLGLADLAAARARHAEAQAARTELALAQQRLALLAPKGLPALREDCARLTAEAVAEPAPQGDAASAKSAFATAGQRVTDSRNAAREMQAARTRSDDALVTAEKGLAILASELAALATTLGPEDGREAREAGLTEAFSAATDRLGTAQERVEGLRAGASDPSTAEARVLRLRSAGEAVQSEMAVLREEIADLNGQIRARSDDAVEEAWAEAKDARVAADGRLERLTREVATLTRLRDALETARASARDHYFEPVMRELRPLIGLLFEDAEVTFDDETLLPRSVRRNGQDEEVTVLSGGMREQLAILTRLAFARLLSRDGQPAPVILDDALVYSDDDRIERMFDALHRQSRDQQIIVFSCRQRAFSELGGNVLRMTDWQPAG